MTWHVRALTRCQEGSVIMGMNLPLELVKKPLKAKPEKGQHFGVKSTAGTTNRENVSK